MKIRKRTNTKNDNEPKSIPHARFLIIGLASNITIFRYSPPIKPEKNVTTINEE
jgi:hypothetical protein